MSIEKNNYQVDEHGYYGHFGGDYIPEMLYPNIEELRNNYLKIIYEDSFQKEFTFKAHHIDSCMFSGCQRYLNKSGFKSKLYNYFNFTQVPLFLYFDA